MQDLTKIIREVIEIHSGTNYDAAIDRFDIVDHIEDTDYARLAEAIAAAVESYNRKENS